VKEQKGECISLNAEYGSPTLYKGCATAGEASAGGKVNVEGQHGGIDPGTEVPHTETMSLAGRVYLSACAFSVGGMGGTVAGRLRFMSGSHSSIKQFEAGRTLVSLHQLSKSKDGTRVLDTLRRLQKDIGETS